MPPRIPGFHCLRAQSAPHCTTSARAFSSTPSPQASTITQRRRHRDPYAIAQARAKKAANLSRQGVLKQERAAVLGDPVRGVSTPFVQSFDTALAAEPSPSSASKHVRTAESPSQDATGARTETNENLNFFLSQDELSAGVKRSHWLTTPLHLEQELEEQQNQAYSETPHSKEGKEKSPSFGVTAEIESIMDTYLNKPDYGRAKDMMDDYTSEETPAQRRQRLQEEHETAHEALKRISSLSLGSSKDRMRVNVQRCIDTFGRHNTDQTIPTKPASTQASGNALEKFPRIGLDTGSSEVQIAILTAKIKTLADYLELRGHPDKMNKRNLRVLVHRRAKLLKYLRRKERGGPRWQNLIETLGLTDGTWKGEITM